jgi:transcriptional regulator with XRE-family HTH domain
MSASIRFEDWLEERLTDPEFRAEWEASEPGFQVALLRIRRGLTQAQLAERVGTTQSSIARLESGRTEPRLSFLRRVVEALGGHLTIQIAGGEDMDRLAEAAPTVRASAPGVTVAWAYTGRTWLCVDLSPILDPHGAALGAEYCPPTELQVYPPACISRVSLREKTAVLQ